MWVLRRTPSRIGTIIEVSWYRTLSVVCAASGSWAQQRATAKAKHFDMRCDSLREGLANQVGGRRCAGQIGWHLRVGHGGPVGPFRHIESPAASQELVQHSIPMLGENRLGMELYTDDRVSGMRHGHDFTVFGGCRDPKFRRH